MEISKAFGSGLQGSGFKPWHTKGSGSMRLHGCLCSQRQNARWKLRPSSSTPVESTNVRRFLLRFLEVAVISQNISTKQNNTNTIHTAQAINCGELDSEDVSQGSVVSRHGRVAPQFGCSPWIGSVFGAVFNNVLRDTNQQQHIGNIHWINIVSVGLGCGVSKMQIQWQCVSAPGTLPQDPFAICKVVLRWSREFCVHVHVRSNMSQRLMHDHLKMVKQWNVLNTVETKPLWFVWIKHQPQTPWAWPYRDTIQCGITQHAENTSLIDNISYQHGANTDFRPQVCFPWSLLRIIHDPSIHHAHPHDRCAELRWSARSPKLTIPLLGMIHQGLPWCAKV